MYACMHACMNVCLCCNDICSFITSPSFLCNQAAFTRSATKNHAGGAPSWLTTKHLEEHLSLLGRCQFEHLIQ